MLSNFVSTLGCTWNSQDGHVDSVDRTRRTGSMNLNTKAKAKTEQVEAVRTVSYPSLSMLHEDDLDHHHDHDHQKQQNQKQEQSSSSAFSIFRKEEDQAKSFEAQQEQDQDHDDDLHHHQKQKQNQEQSSSFPAASTSPRKEDVQTKISNLMSRKVFYEAAQQEQEQHEQDHDEDQDRVREQQHDQLLPGRQMLENVYDSFDQLVDSRIRAYAQILRNHIQVLRNMNDERGALIVEYKLRTLLEYATNNALFDSVSTTFKVLSNDDVAATATATKSMNEEKLQEGKDEEHEVIYVPIEMTVEISSNSLHHDNHQQHDHKQLRVQEHEGKQKKKVVIFKTTGTIRGERFLIGPSVDTIDTCRSLSHPEHDISQEYDSIAQLQSQLSQSAAAGRSFEFGNITVELNCEFLLSQMIEEASTIVSLTVELTNLAWTNNTKKQQEINDSTMSLSHQQEQERQAAAVVAYDADASLSSTVANIIADDDDSIYIPPATGQRSRANSLDDMIMGPPGSNVHIVRHELSFCGGSSNGSSSLPVVSEEETDEHQDQEEEEAPTNTTAVTVAAAVSSSSTSSGAAAPTMTKTATFTNLDVVHRDANKERKRKSRDFVSVDQSFVSELLDEEQQEHDLQEQDFNNDEAALEEDTHKNNDVDVDVDAEYYKIAAERACSIVDFVFAGEDIDKFMDVRIPSSSAKRLRFE